MIYRILMFLRHNFCTEYKWIPKLYDLHLVLEANWRLCMFEVFALQLFEMILVWLVLVIYGGTVFWHS